MGFRRNTAFVLLIFFSGTVGSQSLRQDSLQDFLDRKNKITSDAMYVLGGWSILNIGTGIYGSITTEGTQQAFHQMNSLWGGVNLVIAYAGLRALKSTRNHPAVLMRAEMDQKKTERLFLINAGLDIVYMGAGFGMKEWAKSEPEYGERIVGFGNSFLMQGAFLFGFDVAVYLIHRSNRKKNLKPLLEGLSFHGNRIIYKFG